MVNFSSLLGCVIVPLHVSLCEILSRFQNLPPVCGIWPVTEILTFVYGKVLVFDDFLKNVI